MIAQTARDPEIFTKLRHCHMEHYCLYIGALSVDPNVEQCAVASWSTPEPMEGVLPK